MSVTYLFEFALEGFLFFLKSQLGLLALSRIVHILLVVEILVFVIIFIVVSRTTISKSN